MITHAQKHVTLFGQRRPTGIKACGDMTQQRLQPVDLNLDSIRTSLETTLLGLAGAHRDKPHNGNKRQWSACQGNEVKPVTQRRETTRKRGEPLITQ